MSHMAAVDAMLERLGTQDLSMLVEVDGTLLFASDREGLAPLKETAFKQPHLLDGSDVILPAVGLAAAYLLIYAKVGRVYARTMTHKARAAFNEEGIEHGARGFAKTLPTKYAEMSADLDARAKKAISPAAFVEELRRMLD